MESSEVIMARIKLSEIDSRDTQPGACGPTRRLNSFPFAFFIVIATINKSVAITIKNAKGKEFKRRVGPQAPGWVSLESISDNLILAIITSEDSMFFQHNGVDLFELKEAIKKDFKEKRWAR